MFKVICSLGIIIGIFEYSSPILRTIGADPFTFSGGLDKLLDVIYNIKKAKADLEILNKMDHKSCLDKRCLDKHFFPFAKDQYIGRVNYELEPNVYQTFDGIFNNECFMIRGVESHVDDLSKFTNILYGDFFPYDSPINFIGICIQTYGSEYEYRFGTFKLDIILTIVKGL